MWLGEKHREGLATLKYGLLQNKGFLMITGDVGTGKTALIKAIEKEIEAHIMLITIPDPSLSLLEFYNVMANELGMNRTFDSKGAFLIEFKRLVLKAAAAHRYVLMIIDEAHRLTSELLEEIRLLSNIDLGGQVLVSTFLVGQLELKELISKTENRAVRQRISVAYELLPLTFEETEQYISHRLHVSGSKSPIFTPEAIRVVHARSFGYPRLINIICDHALVTGFVSGAKTIGPEIIEECCNELRITLGPNPTEGKSPVPTAENFETAPLAPPFSTYLPNANRGAWRLAGIVSTFAGLLGLGWFYEADLIRSAVTNLVGISRERISGGTSATVAEKEPTSQPIVDKEIREIPTATPAPKIPEVAEKQASDATINAREGSNPAPAGSLAEPQSDRTQPARVQATAPQPPAPPPEPRVGTPKKIQSQEAKVFTVNFEKGSAELPAYADEQLTRAASVLKKFPEARAVIEGHTDSTGDPSSERVVSYARAASVRDYLLDQGIEPRRLKVSAHGSQKPLETNNTSEDRGKNRRGVIRIVDIMSQ
jgi:general secretion pathway protein A